MAQQLSARQPHYKHILLRLSGKALMGLEESGIDSKVLDHMMPRTGQLVGVDVQADLVIGDDNLFRGAVLSVAGIDRVTGDYMGILVIAMNGLVMHDALERSSISALAMSTTSTVSATDHHDRRKAMRYPGGGEVVIFSAGIGNLFFIIDSTVCPRAIEIDADVVPKATKVDGVYTADPFEDPNAEKSERPTCDEVLDHELGAMDLATVCLRCDQNMSLWMFNTGRLDALLNTVVSSTKGTLVEEG